MSKDHVDCIMASAHSQCVSVIMLWATLSLSQDATTANYKKDLHVHWKNIKNASHTSCIIWFSKRMDIWCKWSYMHEDAPLSISNVALLGMNSSYLALPWHGCAASIMGVIGNIGKFKLSSRARIMHALQEKHVHCNDVCHACHRRSTHHWRSFVVMPADRTCHTTTQGSFTRATCRKACSEMSKNMTQCDV